MSRNKYGEKSGVSVMSVIEVIIIIILAVMIAGMIICNVIFHDDSKAASIFGYSFYKTRAVNMVPEIPVNTVIIAKKSEIPNIKERSVILCNIGEFTALTRVKEIGQSEDGSIYYIVKFDTSPDNETVRIESGAVIAKAVWQLESFGKFLDFATSAPGIIVAVIIPLAAIIIFQIVRIKNIRELEREASSIDDIGDIFERSKEEEPPAVTFTEPKFTEDVTGKLPNVKKRLSYSEEDDLPAVRPYASFEKEEKPKAKLTVDANGRADYAAVKESRKPEQPAPFIRLEGTSPEKEETKRPAETAPAQKLPDREELYFNRPTKIEQPPAEDEFSYASSDGPSESYGSDTNRRAGFAPYLSNVIPESLANIQDEAASSNTRSGFDESVKAYFEKSERKTVPDVPSSEENGGNVSTIPKMAVVPKENIAPVKKKKNSKTLEELMSIIDSEENKLKK